MNAVEQIRAFNAGREPERLLMKYEKMRTGAFSFLRGACHVFYAQLPRGGIFKSVPLAWVCGDMHLENFGSYKGDNRLVYFDLNDFDESALAPATWELVRLATSALVGADDLGLPSKEADALCVSLLDAYANALAAGKAYWLERDTAQGLVRGLLDSVRERHRPAFLDSRSSVVNQGKRKVRKLSIDGKKLLAITPAQRSQVTEFMQGFAATQEQPDFYQVLDVARRVAGTGSLGVVRYAILVRGKGSPDNNYLLDLKQALPSALVARLKVAQPAWQSDAHRVVALQRRMQAVSMAFLQPVMLGSMPCVLRALQPSEDRVSLSGVGQSAQEHHEVVATMGRLIAWAQLRSAARQGSAGVEELIDFGQRSKWRGKLLDAAQDCATQTRKDAAAFNQAFDDGYFAA